MPDDVCGVKRLAEKVKAPQRETGRELFVEEENRAPVVEATHLIHATPPLC